MRIFSKRIIYFATILFLLITSAAISEWPPEGLQVIPQGNIVLHRFQVAPDSAGGAYIGWFHNGDPSNCLVQRIDREGNFLWEEPGLSPSEYDTLISSADFLDLLPAPGGGVYVTYLGYVPNVGLNVYVQKFSPDGELEFGHNSVALTNAPENEYLLSQSYIRDVLVPDGEGGIIQGYWIDNYPPNASSLHAARLDWEGELLWTGAVVCDYGTFGFFNHVQAVSDGEGGAIFVWDTNDNSPHGVGIFAQRINADGETLWPDVNRVFDPNYLDGLEEFPALCTWEPGEFMFVEQLRTNGPDEWSLQHVNEDGEPTLGNRGQFITSSSDLVNNAGVYDLVKVGDYLIIPFVDMENGTLYKVDESGEHFFCEEGIQFDPSLILGAWETDVFADEERTTLIYLRVDANDGWVSLPHAIAFNNDGSTLWEDQSRPLITSEDIYFSELRACEVGQDTFFVAFEDLYGTGVFATMLYPDGSTASYPENPVEEKESLSELPQELVILNTYPNPFNSSVTIEIESPSRGETAILIYDLLGRNIYEEFYYLSSGNNRIEWKPGKSTPSGIYFISIGTNSRSSRETLFPGYHSNWTQKVILLK